MQSTNTTNPLCLDVLSRSNFKTTRRYILGRRHADKIFLRYILRSDISNLIRIRLWPARSATYLSYGYLGYPLRFFNSTVKKDNFFAFDHPPIPSLLKGHFFRVVSTTLRTVLFDSPLDFDDKIIEDIEEYVDIVQSKKRFSIGVKSSFYLKSDQVVNLYIKESSILDSLSGGQLASFARDCINKLSTNHPLLVSTKQNYPTINSNTLKVTNISEVELIEEDIMLDNVQEIICPTSLKAIELWLIGKEIVSFPGSYVHSLANFHMLYPGRTRKESFIQFLRYTLVCP